MLVFVPAYSQLSDRTGLVNRLDIAASGHNFEVEVVGNFDIRDYDFSKDDKKLTLVIQSGLERNLGEVIIPRGLLSGNFTFLLNSEEYHPKFFTSDRVAFITLAFNGTGTNQVDIFATKHLEGVEMPEISNSTGMQDGGGCLIATATYGTELAPQVQMLREIRDGKIMNTDSGASFVSGFNQIYYAFSPHIADYQRQNPLFNDMVRIAITPMISSLSILSAADIDSEYDVMGYGVGIILLNIGMYVGAPMAIVCGVRKITRSSN